MTFRLFLLLLMPLLFMAESNLCLDKALAAAEQEADKKEGIYVWTDEQGVVHMRDKKPEEADDSVSRMERRQRFLENNPEARSQSQSLSSGQKLTDDQGATSGQRPPDYVPHSPEDFPSSSAGSEQLPGDYQNHEQVFPQSQEFQLSPVQMLSVMAVPLLLGLLFYVAASYVLYRIGLKFGIGTFVGYLVPIYNIVLLCRCAGVSGWFVIFLFLPLVNIFVTFLIWGKIAERLGKNMMLWGILITLLGLPALILAFDSSRPVDMPRPGKQQPPEEQPNVYI